MKIIIKRPPATLAIIGNGFDMNHGYDTRYSSFAEANEGAPAMAVFESYCGKELPGRTWYDFENNIRDLTEKLFLQSYDEEHDYDENRKRVKELKDAFTGIHVLLTEYLRKEISSKPLTKKACIRKHLNNRAVAVNFNYTDTAEAYTDNVIYVHGSLKENDILLGYDYREEACLAEYEDMRWYKEFEREALAFRRALRKCPFITPGSKIYSDLTDALESYQIWDNSGRGLQEEASDFLPYYRLIDRFVKRYRKYASIPNIDYKHIKTLAVIGHGVEADRVYLDRILSKCVNLEKVVLYRHEKEDDSEFKKRASFFRTYCSNIRYIKY